MNLFRQVTDKFYDYFEVPQFTFLAVSLTFTNVELAMKILSLFLAMSYTLWKWRSDVQEKARRRALEGTSIKVKKKKAWYLFWKN